MKSASTCSSLSSRADATATAPAWVYRSLIASSPITADTSTFTATGQARDRGSAYSCPWPNHKRSRIIATKPRNRLKLLFADDEKSLQELMSLELPRMGHEV